MPLALAISESLRNALSLTPGTNSRPQVPAPVTPSSSSGPSTKSKSYLKSFSVTLTINLFQERRLNATNSIKIAPAVTPTKLRSASPTTVTTIHVTQQKSRLSRQTRPPVEDLDLDADGDDDAEEDNEDESLYCICQKQSYGDVSNFHYRKGEPFSLIASLSLR